MGIFSFLKKQSKQPVFPAKGTTTTAPPGMGGKGTLMTQPVSPPGIFVTPSKPLPSEFNIPPPPPLPIPKPTPKSGGGGGTYYTSSGTYVSPEGVGVSIAEPPKEAIISTQPNPQLVKQKTAYIPPKVVSPSGGGEAQKKEGFSGEVNIYNNDGKLVGQEYYVRGTKTGEITYAVKKGTTHIGQTGVTLSTPSKLTFKTPTEEKTVTFTKEGAEFQTTTFLPGEIQIPNYEIPSYELSTGTYTEGRKGYSRSLENVPYGTQLKGKTQVIGTYGEKLPTLPTSSTLSKVMDFAVGKSGESFVGIGVYPTSKPLITASDIKQTIITNKDVIGKFIGFKSNAYSSPVGGSFIVNVGAELIPTTPIDVALYGVGGELLSKASPIVKYTSSGIIGYSGIKTALNPELTPAQRTAGGIIAFGGTTGFISEIIKPVRIGITPKFEEFKSNANTLLIKEGDKFKTVSQFNVLGAEAPRFEYTVKRYELIRNEIVGTGPRFGTEVLSKTNLKQKIDFSDIPKLNLAFGTGKVNVYSEPALIFARTEPFYVNQKGEITRPVRKIGMQRVGIEIIKATPSKTSTFYSSLEGFTERKEYNVNIVKENLGVIPKKAFEQIEILGEKNGIKVLQKFPRESTLSMGEIKTQKLFKIDNKGNIKVFQPGRTINRGALVGVRNQVFNREFPNEFGLKEITGYKEKIGFVDITFPKMRAPKKSLLIEGSSKEYYVELPSETNEVRFIQPSGKRSSQQYLMNMYKSPKIQEQIISTALTSSKVLSVSPVKTISRTVTPVIPILSTSQYTGMGLYERTEGGLTPGKLSNRNIFITRTGYAPSTSERTSIIDVSSFFVKGIDRNLNKEVSRNVNRNINRELTKEITREETRFIQRPVQRVTQRVTQRLVPRQTEREITKMVPPIFPRLTPSSNKQKSPSFSFSFGRQPKLSQGIFSVFMRRFGKFNLIGKTKTQKEAFQLGMFKTRTTLGASFKVKGLGVKYPQKIFGYKTKPTKKGIYYIEEPKWRLSTPTEKAEIQYYKSMNNERRY